MLAAAEEPEAALEPTGALEQPKVAPHLFDGQPLRTPLQWYAPPRRPYTRRELLADRCVNFLAWALACLSAPLLGFLSWQAGDSLLTQLGFWAQGAGLVVMTGCSAIYHYRSWDWTAQPWLQTIDHVGISACIMGNYTPPMLRTGSFGILAFVWGLGIVGSALEACKACFKQRASVHRCGSSKWTVLDIFHVVRYLIMGWAVVIVWWKLARCSPISTQVFGIAGGVIVTLGVFVFTWDHLEYHMAIWHTAVLCSMACFYCMGLSEISAPTL